MSHADRLPRCCGLPMNPAPPYHVEAVSHDARAGTQTVVESSVWACQACGNREARPERWRELEASEAAPMRPVNRVATVLARGNRNGRR